MRLKRTMLRAELKNLLFPVDTATSFPSDGVDFLIVASMRFSYNGIVDRVRLTAHTPTFCLESVRQNIRPDTSASTKRPQPLVESLQRLRSFRLETVSAVVVSVLNSFPPSSFSS